jgi:hypothetical protein
VETGDARGGCAAIQCDAFRRYATGGCRPRHRGAVRDLGRSANGDTQPVVWDSSGAYARAREVSEQSEVGVLGKRERPSRERPCIQVKKARAMLL